MWSSISGGGTLDVTVLDIGGGVFEVKSIAGDGFLGGDDFDQCLLDWIEDELYLDHGFSLSRSTATLGQVRSAAIQAKCDLSFQESTTIEIPFLSAGTDRSIPFRLDLSRKNFNAVCAELFERMIPPCRQALKTANLSPQSLSKVVLVGAATRMANIDDVIFRAFGIKPSRAVNPDEAVAIGAALQGGVLKGEVRNLLLLDVTPHPLGLETSQAKTVTIIDKNTTIPTRKSEIFTTSYDNQSSVEINVLEGGHLLAFENRRLGRLVLDGIPPAPRGTAQIEVTFEIDTNALLRVAAQDLGTGRTETTLVIGSSLLQNSQIEELGKLVQQISINRMP